MLNEKELAQQASMNLPSGRTCGDCKFIGFCEELFSCDRANTWCDWAPSRFILNAKE